MNYQVWRLFVGGDPDRAIVADHRGPGLEHRVLRRQRQHPGIGEEIYLLRRAQTAGVGKLEQGRPARPDGGDGAFDGVGLLGLPVDEHRIDGRPAGHRIALPQGTDDTRNCHVDGAEAARALARVQAQPALCQGSRGKGAVDRFRAGWCRCGVGGRPRGSRVRYLVRRAVRRTSRAVEAAFEL